MRPITTPERPRTFRAAPRPDAPASVARTGADDLVRFLLERTPGAGLIDRKTGLPYGLSLWLRNVADR